jgi:hypothetical protein
VPSACDTGPGEAAGGGNVFGLQQAFHLGGCRDVVAGLWGVADEPRGAGGPVRARPVGEGAEAARLTLPRHPRAAFIRIGGPE